ncbi:MAG: type II toxin-antitoxin system VapC family toxin [Thermodesulfobacteriota bacterium]
MEPLFLLDTDICIYIAKERPPQVRERFARHPAGELAMSVVTCGELWHGAEKSLAPERARAALQGLTEVLAVLALPADAGRHYGRIRAALERMGQPIGNNDLWIAAHACAAGLCLVSNNEREFARIAGLRWENWAAPPGP